MSEPPGPPKKVCEGKDGVELHRIENGNGIPVLLLHGGGARHGTFLIPKRDIDEKPRGLADWLADEGFEPWLLDWRAGATVVEKAKKGAARGRFDMDHAAKHDIPFALNKIREIRGDAERIGAVGHCLGAGVLAQAIASGSVPKQEPPPLTHVVLLTLGLFYETPLESRLKSEDRALERLWKEHPDVDRIDPCPPNGWPNQVVKWPGELEEIYQNWPRAMIPHPEEERNRACEVCNRASFMYGKTYLESQLVPEIHDDIWPLSFELGKGAPVPGEVVAGAESGAKGTLVDITLTSGSWSENDAAGVLRLIAESGKFQPKERLLVGETEIASCTDKNPVLEEAQLPLQFGAIPLRMFMQAARNVRRRWAARFDEFDPLPGDNSLVKKSCRKHFHGLSVTLLTGARNQLWSPDSIHRMYEWLLRGRSRPGAACRKVILKDYGHQDLLWGRSASRDVFPEIGKGLGLKE
jgi:hypothetical protein